VALANPVDGVGAAPGWGLSVSATPAFRPGVAICGSVIAFALLIERLGFPATVMVTVLLASAGSRQMNGRQSLLLAVVVAAAMTAVFVGLLDQPLSLVPRG
jgi:hypothetical protein